jgi:type I restriction enzyme S subunit
MEKQKKIPELRFPEFKDDWEKKRYGDIFSFRTTNSYSRENLNYIEGKVKNIHYGDIHTKFNTLFDIEKESVPFINSQIKLNGTSNDNYCQVGDLIIADASEDYEDVGKCIEMVNLNSEKVLAGLHTILARPDLHKMSIGFNGYLMKSEKIRLQIKTIAQGSKVLSISTGRLSDLNLIIPAVTEQQKIASFLTVVDDKLQALKKKKELLEQYKNGVMQKIFSQKLCFKDEKGKDFPEWEKKKGKDIFYSYSNKNHNGDLPVLSASQEFGILLRDENGIQIQSSENSIKSYKIVEKGDFVISLRSFQGGIEYSNLKGICSPAYTILKPKIPIVDDFFKYYFKKEDFIERLSKTVVGIRDGKQISYDAFGGLKLSVPSTKEQTKIVNFLSAIDEKINHCQMQIEKTELWKKGLLQKMFV